MIDKDIGGMAWVAIAPDGFVVQNDPDQKRSKCQIEVEVHDPESVSALPQ